MVGSEDEQTEYCFKIYDINNDGYITREEMLTLMKNCLIRSVREAFKKNVDFFHTMGGSGPKRVFSSTFCLFLTTNFPENFHNLGGGGVQEVWKKSTHFFCF